MGSDIAGYYELGKHCVLVSVCACVCVYVCVCQSAMDTFPGTLLNRKTLKHIHARSLIFLSYSSLEVFVCDIDQVEPHGT